MLFALLLAVMTVSGSVAAQESPPADPASVIKAVYAAIEARDLDAAAGLLADDMVLTLIPPPPGLDGVFIGKEAVRGWYEGLAEGNGRFEIVDVTVSGNRATSKLKFWDDSFVAMGIAPAEFDGVNIAQNGKLKSATWIFTEEFMVRFEAAMQQMEADALVRRILQEIWSEGNLDLTDELVAEDYVSHTWPVGEGRDDFKADVTSWRSDFPGATIVVDKIVFDGNRAIIFSHNVGPGGALDEHPPEDVIEDILVYQVENGQLSDRWYFAPFDPTQ